MPGPQNQHKEAHGVCIHAGGINMRTSGPSEQRSLLLPPPCNGTAADGCRQCADLQRKFCKFFEVGKFGKFCKYASLARAVLALECKIRVSFRRFSKIPEILSKILEKTKIAEGGANRGKPHWILWWTTWWPVDRGRRFWSTCGFFRCGRPTLIICNHSFLTSHYSTKVHNLRFSHATSSRASPMEL